MKITIARALKLKNRLQSRIRSLVSDMGSYNSTVAGGAKEVDTREAMTEYDRLIDDLISLKAKIFASNVSVYEKILRLAEIKSKIKVLRSLNTQHGKIVDTYRYGTPSSELEYEANFRKSDVDVLVRSLEDDVDRIQEELDSHNHTNFVEIDEIKF